ncbi:MAG: DUF4249 family protein [Bacteroidetes bacterium]|nr:DUF4249 family protein [Bacteroidota bacterium]
MNKKRYIHNRYKYILRWQSIFFILAIITGSCKKQLYNSQLLPDKMVVLAEITAGDSANIPIGETLSAGSGGEINFQKLNSVSASISSQAGMQSLSLNTSPDFTDNPMAVYSNPANFEKNTEYTLSATEPQIGSISATTKIPNDFSVGNIESEMDDLNGKRVLKFRFVINDAGDEKNYYMFEAVKQLVSISRHFFWQGNQYDYNTPSGYDLYQQVKNNPGVALLLDTVLTDRFIRLNVYTRDSRTDNASMSSLDSSFRRIFITDSLFNGGEYQTELDIDRTNFVGDSPSTIGIVRVQMKSVAKELYDYLSQYEKYMLAFGNFPVNSLVSPSGNINNGFGVFGGSYRKQWSFYYDVLQ